MELRVDGVDDCDSGWHGSVLDLLLHLSVLLMLLSPNGFVQLKQDEVSI